MKVTFAQQEPVPQPGEPASYTVELLPSGEYSLQVAGVDGRIEVETFHAEFHDALREAAEHMRLDRFMKTTRYTCVFAERQEVLKMCADYFRDRAAYLRKKPRNAERERMIDNLKRWASKVEKL